MPALGRIIVAEDEDGDIELMRCALARANVKCPVSFAHDGLEAIHCLEGSPECPVLLLLDINMPELNGFDVLRWLRTQPSAAWVSVVVLSSSGESDDIRQAAALGALCYIVKPPDVYELARAMERAQELWGDKLAGVGHPPAGMQPHENAIRAA